MKSSQSGDETDQTLNNPNSQAHKVASLEVPVKGTLCRASTWVVVKTMVPFGLLDPNYNTAPNI